jgi:hypothetical protein
MIRDTINPRITANMTIEISKSRLFAKWFKRCLSEQLDRFDKSSLATIK